MTRVFRSAVQSSFVLLDLKSTFSLYTRFGYDSARHKSQPYINRLD